MTWQSLEANGFCLLRRSMQRHQVDRLRAACADAFSRGSGSELTLSSHGHVYAARNLIDSIPEVRTAWQTSLLRTLLRDVLGDGFGLVRALFFDKPPDRSWNLPWHKDTSIAVRNHSVRSPSLTRPTVKAGVPHFIACDAILHRMLTLRIHLDDVTDENGPLRVIPQSHVSAQSDGCGCDQAVTIHASAGDVLAMRPLISHASGSSIRGTRRHRRILHLEFASAGSLPDGVQWHDFVTEEHG